MEKESGAKLIVAASEASADMLYATGFRVPDAFAFVEVGGRSAVLLSDLEVDRGRREARVDEVVGYSDVAERVKGRGRKEPPFAAVVAGFLREQGVRRAGVPGDFPLGLATALGKLGIGLKPATGHFWPDRETKSAAELKLISAALRVTEIGLQVGVDALRAAKIRKKDGVLVRGRSELTSEALRAEIESAMLRAGGLGGGQTIVAGGEQACDPHERGRGPLRGSELIILDIFPRMMASGFFGDMTRTVVRGRATEAQREMWEVCLAGQKGALKGIGPGVDGGELQEAVRDFFEEAGFPTEQVAGRWTGFFHGLGHGLGLEIHEEPRISKTTFRAGQVLTVEPGIYVPGIGGVRHEDVVVVTERGNRVLSKFPKVLEV